MIQEIHPFDRGGQFRSFGIIRHEVPGSPQDTAETGERANEMAQDDALIGYHSHSFR